MADYPLNVAKVLDALDCLKSAMPNPNDRRELYVETQIELLCDIAQSLQEIKRATHHLAVISGQGYE